jgi:hypothetical protein
MNPFTFIRIKAVTLLLRLTAFCAFPARFFERRFSSKQQHSLAWIDSLA